MPYKSKGSELFKGFLRNDESNETESMKDVLSEKLRKTYENESSSRRTVVFLEKISETEKPKKWKELDKQTKQRLLKKYMYDNNICGKISDYAISKVVYSNETKKIEKANMRRL